MLALTTRTFKLGLLLFWALYFSIVFIINWLDALKAAGILGDGWKFASGNWTFLRTTTGIYDTPGWMRPDLLPVLNTSFDGESRYLAAPEVSWQKGEQARFDEVYQGVLQGGGMLYGFAMPDGELHTNPSRDTLVPSQARILIAIERDTRPSQPANDAGVTLEGSTPS
jgi:hypothetical protein